MAADGPRFSFGQVQCGEEVGDGLPDKPSESIVGEAEPVKAVVFCLTELNELVAQGVGQRPRLMGDEANAVVVDVDEGQVEAVDAGASNCADVKQG